MVSVRARGRRGNYEIRNPKFEVYPNPFIGVTEIRYEVSPVGAIHELPLHVNITVYNLSEQRVATIVDERKKPGYYTTKWNAPKNLGSGEVGADAPTSPVA